MKRQRVDIKKKIKKRIELRHASVKTINKMSLVNNNKKRIYSDPNVKPVHVELLSRVEKRTGNFIQEFEPQPILINKQPVSIIITAYEAQDFIMECLDSIEKQTYFIKNNKFEVLVGVDGCQRTLNKLNEIRHNYRNLKIFMMNTNMGAYVTLNTLLNIVGNENIIIFGADDVMKPEMINEIMYHVDDNEIVQFGFTNFRNGIITPTSQLAIGAIFIKNIVYLKSGGYQPWKCSGDIELLYRVGEQVKIHKINTPLFHRRLHENNLTLKADTGMKSILRNEYKKLIRKYNIGEDIKIKRIINEYSEK